MRLESKIERKIIRYVLFSTYSTSSSSFSAYLISRAFGGVWKEVDLLAEIDY